MFDTTAVKLNDLKLAPAFDRILEYHGFTEGLKLIDAIEIYKIMSRQELTRRLNEKCSCRVDYISMVTSTSIFTLNARMEPVELIREKINEELPADLVEVADKYNVAIEVNGETLIIFASIASSFNSDSLDLALMEFPHEIVRVTPENFREIMCIPAEKRDLLLLIRRIAVECMKEGGSDLKLDVIYKDREPTVRIRFRVDETMIESKIFPNITINEEEEMIKQLIQVHSSLSVNDLDGGYAEGYIDSLICDPLIESRFGVSKLLVGFFINIRIQALTPNNFSVDKLGLDYDTVAALEYAEKRKQGITLITGPMKSGKSTTLWGMMGTMIKLPISCIEYSSPVEAKMALPQIDYNKNLEKLKGLLSVAKKQDINVAFLNEIPDAGIAQGVRDLANSNVHVITTFHLDRIWDLPHKLYEYYGDSFKNIMSQINLVVNQKMYVRQCPHCRIERIAEDTPPIIAKFLTNNGIKTVWDNKGCSYCNNGELKGGRLPKTEWIIFNDEIIESLRGLNEPRDMEKYLKDLVLQGKEYKEKRVALEYKLLDSVKSGELSYKELYTLKTLGGRLDG